MRGQNKLTQLKVNSLKAVGKYSDGLGLYLLIPRPGEKFWTFRYMRAGKARQCGLGPLHSVSLVQARARALEARQLLLDGKDPIAIKHEHAQAKRLEELRSITFREACERFLQTDRVENFRNAVHRKQWASTLAKAYPVLGDLPLQSIDSAILLRVLLPVMKATPETGSRLRGRVERVIEWARPLGLFAGPNPAAREALKDHLPAKRRVEHHKALPYGELPALVAELRKRDYVSAKALEFVILTAARTGEAIGMTWDEVDLAAKTWVVPGDRMKAGKEHIVPLSERAVELLHNLQSAKLPNRENFVFINGGGKPLSNQAMSEMLKGMGVNATVHGFRSSFRDWCFDFTAWPRDVVEAALAHVVANKTEAAYRRSTALAKRRKLMEAWSRYCEAPAAVGDNVVNLSA